jgi:hypothetical protein
MIAAHFTPRRRLLQFRLKTLLLVTAVLCVPLAWVGVRMNQKRQERAVIAAIEWLGGIVKYEWQGKRADGVWQHDFWRTAKPTGPHWIRQIVGDDFFTDVVYVGLSPNGHLPVGFHTMLTPKTDTDATVKDDDLRLVGSFSKLEEVNLTNSEIDDAGLVHLQRLANLRCLTLQSTNITDGGLIHLRHLLALRDLNLGHTKITDSGLQHLTSLTGLQHLNLLGTKTTRAGVDDLAKALPGCKFARP